MQKTIDKLNFFDFRKNNFTILHNNKFYEYALAKHNRKKQAKKTIFSGRRALLFDFLEALSVDPGDVGDRDKSPFVYTSDNFVKSICICFM